jgi:serine/threonine protein kinase
MALRPEDWTRAREVFERAVELPSAERLPYVAVACSSNAALRAEIERMLASHARAAGFLSTPAALLVDDPIVAESLAGQQIGPYLVSSIIGAGGMGVVYKARDTRLDRTVALKVFPAYLADDAHARDRFEREARAVAALSHPHICTLHDVGHHEGIDFLVMEHLDGETLAARLAKGPLPLDRALDIGIQIASALDSAHRAGIVHRDLKPGNVILTKTGAKLLDFGLAKAVVPPIGAAPERQVAASDLTTPGAMIGTVQYMAPEQLEGRHVDTRTDIFAFGAVLYEMVTGRKAFEGGSQAGLIAAILEHQPLTVSSFQPLTPPILDRVVATCLAKEPDDRWQTARDLLRELTWLRDGAVAARPASAAADTSPGRLWSFVAAGLALVIVGVIAIYWSADRHATPASRVEFSIYPPEGTKFPRGTAELAVSPDGSRIAFVAVSADGSHLWVRRLNSTATQLLDGTEDASYPFWSPDSHSIGFAAHGKLQTIAEAGGIPRVLCDLAGFRGGTWGREGSILFASLEGPIRRVHETGGDVTPVTTLSASRKERGHVWPVFLPDGRRFLYLARGDDQAEMGIHQGSTDGTETHHLLAGNSNVALAGPYLLSLAKGSLLAHRYDPDGARLTGEPLAVADHIAQDAPLRSGGPFSVANGVLAYRSASPDSHLVWFDRSGKEVGAFRARGDYHHPSFSPDETQVVIERTDPATGRHTIWTLDLARQTISRLVADAAGAHQPVWSPDGRRVAFVSHRANIGDVYWTRADGGGGDEMVLRSTEKLIQEPTDWSLDGRFLLYDLQRSVYQHDLWILPVSPPQPPRPFVASPANDHQGQFSPDVRWIAYTSDESGAPEVYVRRFPDGGGKWHVSTEGGAQPRWRRDGKELFYLAPGGRLMAANVISSGSTFATAAPRVLFDTGITTSVVETRNQYLVTRDGQRFLLNISAEDENSAPITVVLNWDSPLTK